MKRKRQKDAEIYQKILKEQIEEKNNRKLKTNVTIKRGKTIINTPEEIQNINSKNTCHAMNDSSPVVASSRYSNTNTAATRNLFTPSEDNCLSQHLANYTTAKKKERAIMNSDCANLIGSDKRSSQLMTPTLWNTVIEERSRDEINDDESLVAANSSEKQKNLIMVQNQEDADSSIVMLEGYVGTLLKEQEILKNKLMEQEKRLWNLKNYDQDDENVKPSFKINPLKAKRHSVHENNGLDINGKIDRAKIQINNGLKSHRDTQSRQKIDPIRIKIRSTPRSQKRNEAKLHQVQSNVFGNHRGSVEPQELHQESHFLDNKASHQINNNHNIVSKSMGHKNIMSKIQSKLEPSNMKVSSKMSKRMNENNFKDIFMVILTSRLCISNNILTVIK